jgi:LacI family gluconate utilization system Gnt-I transcriptional repressor
VATELVEKVQKAALELNYVVNPAARALASAQSHSVVVLVPSLSNLLFIDTLEAIHRVLTPKGFEVLIGNFHYSRDEEENLLRNYMAYQPRGLLLTGFDRTESSRRMIEASNIPCVYMMELDSAAGVNCVGFRSSAPAKPRPSICSRAVASVWPISAHSSINAPCCAARVFAKPCRRPGAMTRTWKC